MSFNVLIVDDSKSMRGVIKKIITISGFKMDQCFEAGNGKEALNVLADGWVDVIMSDINMPEMNGFELLEELQKDDLLKNIPVVVVTTESSEERMQQAVRLGAKGFIKKPFFPEEVKGILHEVIGVDDDGGYGEDPGDNGDLDF
jgi:two-component system chemotaxis response regulator CheY